MNSNFRLEYNVRRISRNPIRSLNQKTRASTKNKKDPANMKDVNHRLNEHKFIQNLDTLSSDLPFYCTTPNRPNRVN